MTEHNCKNHGIPSFGRLNNFCDSPLWFSPILMQSEYCTIIENIDGCLFYYWISTFNTICILQLCPTHTWSKWREKFRQTHQQQPKRNKEKHANPLFDRMAMMCLFPWILLSRWDMYTCSQNMIRCDWSCIHQCGWMSRPAGRLLVEVDTSFSPAIGD